MTTPAPAEPNGAAMNTGHTDHELRVSAARLRALADYMHENAPPRRIDMGYFVTADFMPEVEGDEPSQAKRLARDCGTSFCAAGWEAVRAPRVAARFDDWDEFVAARFPALCDAGTSYWNDLGDGCFDSDLPSDKRKTIARLRRAAKQLERQLARRAK